jgi:hypothetical protein
MSIYTLIAILLLTGQVVIAQNTPKIDKIFEKKLQYGMISKGNNFPDFYPKNDSIDFLLFTLHEELPLQDFANKTGFSNEKVNTLTSFLENKGWIHKVNELYKPTVFVADLNAGQDLYRYAEPISDDISKEIKDCLPEIKKEFTRMDIAKKQSFDDWSFFILSNVLLDSWQIDSVENGYLKMTSRPSRHGKNYFYTIWEHDQSQQVEPFGIYGNQMMNIDNRLICVYGNNRFGYKLLDRSPIISKEDSEIFNAIAGIFLPKLLKVLDKHNAYSIGVYEKMGYHNEITFEEFFIWWYHFIYTQVTNMLSNESIIRIPQGGNFQYELEQ